MNNKLELLIDEPIEGHFYWTLAEPRAPGEPAAAIDFAQSPMPTSRAALDCGIAAMRGHQQGGVTLAFQRRAA